MSDLSPTSSEQSPRVPSEDMLSRTAPPHPLDAQWYLHMDGQTYGPYSGHQLKEYAKDGRVDGASQVMLVGSDKWSRAGEDPRLVTIFRAERPVSPAPPINAAAGATVVHVTNTIASPAPPAVLVFDDGLPFGPKSPGVALLLSFLLCGAGQMYCGRVGKGIFMLVGAILLWVVFLGWIVSIWSMIDAYSTAKQMNLRYLRRMQAIQVI